MSQARPAVKTGRGKILLMDDEAQVRKVAKRMISRLGYEVELAADGAEAIEMYEKAKRSDQPFDAVVLDLTVPGGLGGTECVSRLLEIDPSVKAIVSSGYSTDPIMSSFPDHGFSGVLPKPLRLEQVADVLSKVVTNVK